ncbi:uncharacterized protein LOC126325503 [Schistocerca gregaria]|uniref:uncharacterized protein LOC126325503 n=1 Tax=Schistocerca gregaria TaxID=7010 RepID=UPI00211DFBE3|nr:uncharacterized protein LOC126325503 [Schistocerca gregaria]
MDHAECDCLILQDVQSPSSDSVHVYQKLKLRESSSSCLNQSTENSVSIISTTKTSKHLKLYTIILIILFSKLLYHTFLSLDIPSYFQLLNLPYLRKITQSPYLNFECLRSHKLTGQNWASFLVLNEEVPAHKTFLAELSTNEFFLYATRYFLFVMNDSLSLYRYLIFCKTSKIFLSIGCLLYPLACLCNEPVYKYFYDHVENRGAYQLPLWFCTIGKSGFKRIRFFMTIICLSPLSLCLPIYQKTNFVLIISSIWMSLFKHTVKKITSCLRVKFAHRPPNTMFSKNACYNGFPSGHVSQVVMGVAVVSSLWNIHSLLGYILSLQLLVTVIWIIMSNRHYVSQVFAGSIMGLIFAFGTIEWLGKMYKNIL